MEISAAISTIVNFVIKILPKSIFYFFERKIELWFDKKFPEKLEDIFKLDFVCEPGQNICHIEEDTKNKSHIEFIVKLQLHLFLRQDITIQSIKLIYPYPEKYAFPLEPEISIGKEIQKLDNNYNFCFPLHTKKNGNLNIEIKRFFTCKTEHYVHEKFNYQQFLLELYISTEASFPYKIGYIGKLEPGGIVTKIMEKASRIA